MFCPKCKNLLIIKKDGNKKIFTCSCGYKSSKLEDRPVIKERITKDEIRLEVVDDKTELETLPKVETECPKCHHHTAYYWTMQTRASDEPETKFLKCEKCLHTWRENN